MTCPNSAKPGHLRSLVTGLFRPASLFLFSCITVAVAADLVLSIHTSKSTFAQSEGSTRFVANGLTFVVPTGVGVHSYEEPLLENRQSIIFEVSWARLGISLYQMYGRRYDGPFLITLRPEEERNGALLDSDWRLRELTPHVEGDWNVYEEPSGFNLYVNRVDGSPHYYRCWRLPKNVPSPSDSPGMCEVDQPWPVGNASRTTLIFGFNTNDQAKVVDLNQKVLAFMNGVLWEK